MGLPDGSGGRSWSSESTGRTAILAGADMTAGGSIPARTARRVCAVSAVASVLLVCTEGNARAAVSFIGKSTATTSTAGATTLSLGAPASVVSGNVEIATISLQGNGTVTPPSGWTQIISTSVGASLAQASFWHVAGASEGTTTWTLSSSTKAAGGIIAYGGVDTTTIVDAAGQQTGTSGSTATVPSVTTSYAGDLVLGVGSFNNQGTLTKAGPTTSRYSALVATANGPTILAEDVTQAAAGASATQAITNSTAATAWIGQVIALKAASATGVLSVSTVATPSFSSNLNSGDQVVSYTVPLTTTASVSPAAGWNETITSTQYTTGTRTLSTGASTVAAAPTAVCDSAEAKCVAPTNSVGYPVSVPAGSGPPTAVKFFDAASGTGAGKFTVTPTVSVAVPQNSFAGTYTSTLTLAIASGP